MHNNDHLHQGMDDGDCYDLNSFVTCFAEMDLYEFTDEME